MKTNTILIGVVIVGVLWFVMKDKDKTKKYDSKGKEITSSRSGFS